VKELMKKRVIPSLLGTAGVQPYPAGSLLAARKWERLAENHWAAVVFATLSPHAVQLAMPLEYLLALGIGKVLAGSPNPGLEGQPAGFLVNYVLS
jgi:hypothetical protein